MMGKYIFSVSAVAIFSAIICILSPQKYCKFISFITGLAIMAVMISPLKIIKEFELPQIVQDENTAASKESASKALARSVYEVLCAGYLNKEDILNIAIIDNGDNEFTPIKIKIKLQNRESINTSDMENELSKLYGIDVCINEKTD